ncbi:MAG: DUF2752 domain-containing protein [Gordonia sp. (in: high G+C Gram-positive bacteria)]
MTVDARSAAAPSMPRRPRILGAAAVVGIGGGALVTAAILDPVGVEHGPELCVFRRATGLPCPGCGLTRSWVFLAHGEVGRAFAFNIFGPILFAMTAAAVGYGFWTLVGRPGGVRRRLPPRPVVIGVVAMVAVWLVYGILRAVDVGLGWGFFPAVT